MSKFSPNSREALVAERGVALVELAIFVSLLTFLGFGMIDIALGFDEHATMRDAAQAGALGGARASAGSSQGVTDVARSIAADFLQRAGLEPTQYAISVRPETIAFPARGGTESAVRVIVKRSSAGRFIILSAIAFPSCVTSSFRTNSRFDPINFGPDENC